MCASFLKITYVYGYVIMLVALTLKQTADILGTSSQVFISEQTFGGWGEDDKRELQPRYGGLGLLDKAHVGL